MNELWHILATVLGVITIWLTIWGFRRQDRAENKKKHEENQAALAELINLNRFHPSHSHVEKLGTLSVDGIRYADRPAHGD